MKLCPPGTVVGVAPSSGIPFVATMNSQLNTLGYTTELFATDNDINTRVRSPGYGVQFPRFCFAISINQATLGGGYEYKLRFN